MLADGVAYCFMCKAPRLFLSIAESLTGDFRVQTGQCELCTENMVRVYPLTGEATEVAPQSSEPVYGGLLGDEITGYHGTVLGTQILANVIDSVDVRKDNENQPAQWQKIVAVKAASGHFDSVLRTIASEGLRMRIVMWDPQHGGDIDHPSGMWVIGNGHHRLVAALLLGLDVIPIVLSVNRDIHRWADSADEEWPIERDYVRLVWDVIADRTPGDVVPDMGDVRYACHCDDACCGGTCDDDSQGSAEPSVVPSACTADVIRMHARNAAAQAVWDLMGPEVIKAREQMEKARDLRARAAAMYEAAEEAEAKAEKLDAKVEQLRALYYAAANIAE